MLSVRCRRCPGCLRARRYLWALRAELETFNAGRTLLFTGTFRAQPHERGVAADEVTRYLKRLRWQGSPFRYFTAFERHKSGAWHVHMLLHGAGLSTRAARRPWSAGFSNARVADLRAAAYVTKYVTKDLADGGGQMPRVRASRDPRYGAAVMIHEEAILAMMALRREEMTTDVWSANLRMLHQWLEKNESKESRVWQRINEMTNSDLVLLEDQTTVNQITGEHFPRKK